MRGTFYACAAAVGMLLLTGCLAAEDSVFELLTNVGVEVALKDAVKLPAPTLTDGQDAAKQRKLIEAVVNGKYSWDEFTRRAVTAPFVIKISGDNDQDPKLGRRVDVWFVAYGDLKTLASDDFLNGQLKLSGASGEGADGSHVRILTDRELEKRGISAPKKPEDSRLVAADVTLLDRVRLKTTMRNTKIRTEESVLVASNLDERFAEDQEFPNAWQAITRDAAGRRHIGEPQSYRGIGFYIKATRLAQPAGALLVEYHAAFAEPKGWFQGANLLRSKLPIVAQDAVRKSRRTLEKQ